MERAGCRRLSFAAIRRRVNSVSRKWRDSIRCSEVSPAFPLTILSEENKEQRQPDQKGGNQLSGQADGYDKKSRDAGNDQNQQTDGEKPAIKNPGKHFILPPVSLFRGCRSFHR